MGERFIEFKKIESTGKTQKWECYSIKHKFLLAKIHWHGAWRQYVVEFEPNTIWSFGCLNEIGIFIDILQTNWRVEHENKKIKN